MQMVSYLRYLLDRAYWHLTRHGEEYQHRTPPSLMAEIGEALNRTRQEPAGETQAPWAQPSPESAPSARVGGPGALVANVDLGELVPLVGPLAGERIKETSQGLLTEAEQEELEGLIEHWQIAFGEVRRFMEARRLAWKSADLAGYAHGCSRTHDPGIRCEHGPACSDCMPEACFRSGQSWYGWDALAAARRAGG